jgi:NAD(P)-dependent dehydrogenase (short-subunit alcohol dehydrogenase family)
MKPLEMFSLTGKTALVTGGAGLYGRQIVEALAEAGAKTFTASRNLEKLLEYTAGLSSQGYDVIALRVDLGDEKSVLDLRDQLMEQRGRLDILVNNAVLRPMKGYQDHAASFALSMQVNATGLFIITRAMGDIMARQKSGSIINIASIMGLIGPDPSNYVGTQMHAWYPDYFFHKGGMVNFTRFIASCYGAQGVRCNCVSPGGLFTAKMPEKFVKNYSRRTCLGRLANETDLKGTIVFLASDASAYVTGANILVDGGYTSK